MLLQYPSSSITNDNEEDNEVKKPGQLPIDVKLDVKSKDLLLRLLEVDTTKRLRSLRTLQTIAFYKGYNFENVKAKQVSFFFFILKNVFFSFCFIGTSE